MAGLGLGLPECGMCLPALPCSSLHQLPPPAPCPPAGVSRAHGWAAPPRLPDAAVHAAVWGGGQHRGRGGHAGGRVGALVVQANVLAWRMEVAFVALHYMCAAPHAQACPPALMQPGCVLLAACAASKAAQRRPFCPRVACRLCLRRRLLWPASTFSQWLLAGPGWAPTTLPLPPLLPMAVAAEAPPLWAPCCKPPCSA